MVVVDTTQVSGSKRRYVLTDGLEVFEMRRMDALEFLMAQRNALSNGSGDLWWDGAD